MDPRKERDIEQLSLIAVTQQAQIEHLLKVLASQSQRIDELTGGEGELQQALDLLRELNDAEPGTRAAKAPGTSRTRAGTTSLRSASRARSPGPPRNRSSSTRSACTRSMSRT